MSQSIAVAYEAARTGAVFFQPPAPGFLLLAGADRLDFLQRQTTNDLRALAPGRSVQTVLTSPTARILDLLTLFEWEGGLAALTLSGRGQRSERELRGKIFFMDKVTVTDASAAIAQLDLEGPEAGALLLRLGLAALPGRGEVADLDLEGARVQVIAQPGLCGPGYRLLIDSDRRQALLSVLAGAGAVALDAASHEILRLEAGLPGPDRELTDAYNPLEAGLEALISERKGCYTGQEIIARQISYDKVTKRLAGLRLSAPVAAGAHVLADDKTVGEVTSVADSPRLGPIALAYLKRPHNEAGAVLGVASPDGVTAAIASFLPF